ncbi:MAG TPA: hypothetical protein VG815_20720 [Chloroflexota bacterium]|nr:hypothetical protein [Chloroflexota bacterium]
MGHDGWASDPYVLPSKPSLPADPTLALASTTSSESADEPVLSGAVAGGSLQNNIDLSGQTNPPDPTRNFNGPLVDNGADGNVRVPIEYMGIQNDSIHLGVNSFVPVPPWNFPYMEDYPSFQVPDDFSAKTITETDSFSTYLMYKADMQGSVWIALSEIDWSWTATATNNGTAQNPQWTGPDPS